MIEKQSQQPHALAECLIDYLHENAQFFNAKGEPANGTVLEDLRPVLARWFGSDTAMRPSDATPSQSVFAHRFIKKAPAFAALKTVDRPIPEHVRSCLLELARHVLARLDRIEAERDGE